MKIGFLGMGVMGLPMAKNVVNKSGCEVLGYDIAKKQLDDFAASGGKQVSDTVEIYKNCDVILQILPTHPIIRNSVEQAIQYGKPGNIIVDLSSTAPDIIQELYTCLLYTSPPRPDRLRSRRSWSKPRIGRHWSWKLRQ